MSNELHSDLIRRLNNDIYKTNIHEINVKHTRKKAKLVRFYYEVHSKYHFRR